MRTLLIAFIVVLSFFQIFRLLPRFITPYNYDYYSDRYEHSQYVEGEGSRYILSDYDLYSYAGHYYFTGGEISRVNFENPPLGKYLIGLSIYLFGNQQVIYILYAALFFWVTYLFGMLLFKNQIISLLAIIILLIDPYILHAISRTMLDFPSTTFFLVGLYLFLSRTSKKSYAISCLFFGLSIATKFFPFFAILLGLMILYQRKFRPKYFWDFLFMTPIIFFTYLVSFFEFFYSGKSIIEFISYQWWIIKWRMGNPIVIGNILYGIFTGKAHVWWTNQIENQSWTEEWSLLMPLVFTISLLSIYFVKKNHLFKTMYLYLIIYMLYIIFVTEGGLKYLTPLYPFFAIFTAVTLKLSFKKILTNGSKTNVSKLKR